MTSAVFRFGRFTLDLRERRLLDGGEVLDLSGRYLDALALLVREAGRLVPKDRFMDEVWRGVPVTDEALTQCIRALRRVLGDDAASPRFIETVPKHGYRFIAVVEAADIVAPPPIAPAPAAAPTSAPRPWPDALLLTAAGAIGGGGAGAIGGIFYGFAGASQPLQPGMGAASVLLVLLCVTILVGLVGGAGVASGIALGGFAVKRGPWIVAGGAAGGMVIGAAAKLLGLDAFALLLGQSPGNFTGASEGLVLGAATGLGAWLGVQGRRGLRHSVALAALAGGAAGAAIALTGGRLMGGSLDLLARQFPASRLRLDRLAALLGEDGFGPVTGTVTAAAEGALFAGCVVAAMLLARRQLRSE